MSVLIVEGGRKLSGEVTPIPNKNSMLKIIPAALLTNEPVTIRNFIPSTSTTRMLKIYESLGGKIEYLEKGVIRLNSSGVNTYNIDPDISKGERAGLMFLAPLLHRFKKAEMVSIGGCQLGARPVDTLIRGLEMLGAKIESQDPLRLSTDGLKGIPFAWQLESSVTGTESLIMGAVLAEGETTIYHAACEPHTQDLCNFLVSLGADIQGIGSNLLKIRGVKELRGGECTIQPDFIDVGGLIVAAAITDSEIRIKDCAPYQMTNILDNYAKLSLKVRIEGNDIIVPEGQKLLCKPDFNGGLDKIRAQQWPGFPPDLIPEALVLAVCAEGNIRINNSMYETQLFFVEELLKLKAKVMLADTQTAVSMGPSKLKGATVVAPHIIQCAYALLLASLAANGVTKIENADIIARRFPQVVETFNRLGANIRVE